MTTKTESKAEKPSDSDANASKVGREEPSDSESGSSKAVKDAKSAKLAKAKSDNGMSYMPSARGNEGISYMASTKAEKLPVVAKAGKMSESTQTEKSSVDGDLSTSSAKAANEDTAPPSGKAGKGLMTKLSQAECEDSARGIFCMRNQSAEPEPIFKMIEQ